MVRDQASSRDCNYRICIIMLRSRVMAIVLLTLKASADSSDSCVATSLDVT